jgi:aminoglycoside 2'-N-acetyltransferase I
MLREVVEPGSPALHADVLELCKVAYGEDLTDLLRSCGPGVHVLIRDDERLVSHAMWVTRWVQIESGPLLRTAYVEAVATDPVCRNLGLASRVMRRLLAEIPEEFDIAALSPATISLYDRLGWRAWVGPLCVRMADGSTVATPEEVLMVHELEGRPRVDVRRPISIEWRPGEVW